MRHGSVKSTSPASDRRTQFGYAVSYRVGVCTESSKFGDAGVPPPLGCGSVVDPKTCLLPIDSIILNLVALVRTV